MDEYSRNSLQSTRSYCVLISGCLWTLSCSENGTWHQACTAYISPLGTFHYIHMPFGLANAGSVNSRMLDVALKDVDRDFRTSYLDDILNFRGEAWAHLGHLTQMVPAHAAAGMKIQPCKTKLFQSEMEYFRHKTSKGGVSMIPEDQGLANTKEWQEGGYILGIFRVLLLRFCLFEESIHRGRDTSFS